MGTQYSRALPDRLLRDLAACGVGGSWIGPHAVGEIPSTPGAYALLLQLDRELPLALATLAGAALRPGWYLYAGSAYGPGGIGARVARHVSVDKTLHWHIDRLTREALPAALPLPGGRECDLIARLAASAAFATPVAGFGSSDCRRCASHLLIWRGGRSRGRRA